MTTICTSIRFVRLWPSLMLLALLLAAHTAQAGFSYSADGSEVTDVKTGLIWRRCSEGQSWSGGTCTGTATTYTHEQALVQAKTQTGWRLPNVKELFSLVDKTRNGPAIHPVAFAATPLDWFWTSTPYAKDAANAWVVNFSEGNLDGYARWATLPVRLVR